MLPKQNTANITKQTIRSKQNNKRGYEIFRTLFPEHWKRTIAIPPRG
jgi:hypothetical protein